MNCPLCQTPLAAVNGDPIHPGDRAFGVTLYCPAAKQDCPAQEVMGHGDSEKKALEIILDKYNK